MKTAEAVSHLQRKFKTDKGFRHSYKCTISCCFFDEAQDWKEKNKGKEINLVAIKEIADGAADRFLNLFCE